MLKNMKIGNKLIALVGVFVVGLLAFGGVAHYTVSRVQVNGPIYRELVEKKDIIADILPPPMYIIEPFFVVLDIQGELENGAPAAEIEPLIENFMALREAYYARIEYWRPILTPEDPFYQALMVDSVDSADRFFAAVETNYLPLVRARDAEAADLVIHREIRDLYLEHRAHIDLAVQQTNAANAVLEAATAAEVQIETISMMLIGLGVIVIGIAFGGWISRGITNPVRAMTAAAAQIADGDVNQSISLYSKDEMGQMADSFRSMITYLKEMVTAAQAIAQGDLTVMVNARAQQDVLAHALNDMLTNLRELAGLLNANAEQVSAAAGTLATAADMAGGATQQISVTMTQVAKGATQQADSITNTAASVEEMRRAIDSVAAGAQEQAVAVAQTADVMGKLSVAAANICRAAQQQAQGMTRAAQMRANLADALHQVAGATDEVSTEAERSARSA
jgi:HAMP domain-containing protein